MTKKTTVQPHRSNAAKKPLGMDNRKQWFWLAGISLLLVISLSPSLSGEFLKWDDDWYIQENQSVSEFSLSTIPDLFSQFFRGQYSPVATIILGLEYAIADGQPGMMRFFGILLHLINFLLVFLLAKKLFQKPDLALIIASLFAFHTLQVEAVAWISAQKILLYSAFFLLAILSYLKYISSGKILPYILTLVFFSLSFLSKEQAFTLALCLPAIDYFLHRKWLSTKVLLEKVPFFILAGIMGIATIYASRTGEFFSEKTGSWIAQMVFSGYALLMYFLKLIFPFHLSGFYPFPVPPNGPLPVYMYLFILPLAGLAFLVWRFWKRNPLMVFGILFFFVNIFPVLGFLPLRDFVMADRYVYIPSLGFFFILAGYAEKLYAGRPQLKQKTIVGLALYIFILGILSFGRTQVWKNSYSLFTDMMEKYPDSAVAWNNRGMASNDLQLYPQAEKDYLRAIELNPGFVFAYNNLGIVYTKTRQTEKALKAFAYAMKLRPEFAQAYYNRADAYSLAGDQNNAILDYDRFLSYRPDHANAMGLRGIAKAKTGKMADGLQDLNAAILMNPGDPDLFMNRGVIKLNLKDFQGAISDFSISLQRKPGFSYTLFNRGIAYLQAGNQSLACSDLKEAARLGFRQAETALAQFCR